MTDKHIRRSGDDYIDALAALLPVGPAWPREYDSTLMKLVGGESQIWGEVDGRAADLLEIESDPRITNEMLDTWEFNWGLPDPCFGEALTLAQRHILLVRKITLLGGQSRAFFIEVASWLGYTITIKEYSPFMVGISQVGDVRDDAGNPRWEIGPPEMRFYWTVTIADASLIWFRSAQGEAGVDPHLRIGIADDLECLLNRWKPAHTEIVFDYSSLGVDGPMAGTP
jgi:uncharacterized protein YmfQ (DUF2313 family)